VDVDGAVARMMAYITLNPVRAEMVVEPVEYKWCSYSERMTGWPLQADELPVAGVISREFGLLPSALDGDSEAAMAGVWERFCEMLLGHFIASRDVDVDTVRDLLEREGKPLQLTWP